MQLYIYIYLYTANIELSELIIYCKYALKFSVFDIFLYYTFLTVHFSLTYKRHMRDTPSLKILISPINI